MTVRNDIAAAARYARRLCLFALLGLGVLALGPPTGLFAQGQFTPSEETPEQFPDAAGRDETFYACTACHNFKLVAAQGLDRQRWEDSIDLMINRHNMPALEPADRKVVLDYLETAFPPRAPAGGGWQNPFLSQ